MKWIIPLIFCLPAVSAAAQNPEVIKFKNNVVFPHQAHQKYFKSDCRQCHRKAGEQPGKIEGFGKDAAHRLCKTCHAIKNAGPVACRDCHKK